MLTARARDIDVTMGDDVGRGSHEREHDRVTMAAEAGFVATDLQELEREREQLQADDADATNERDLYSPLL